MSRLEAAVALIQREGRWFLQRRDPRSSVLPGRWEFPGGKLEAGETPREALDRELREELDWTCGEALPLPLVEGAEVILHPFRCAGPLDLGTCLGWGWFSPLEISRLPIPPLNLNLLPFLAAQGPLRTDSPGSIATGKYPQECP